MSPTHTELPVDTIDVWWVRFADFSAPELLAALARDLSPEERLRSERVMDPERRKQPLLSRALLRHVLSSYVPQVPPGTWTLLPDPRGRPQVVTPYPLAVPVFNVSHSGDVLVIAVTRSGLLGVDVERLRPRRYLEALARRHFSASECAWVLAVTPPERVLRFHEIWTLKEAYVKALGLGLSIPLSGFAFDLSVPGVIDWQGPATGDSHHWWFSQAEAENGCVALAWGSSGSLTLPTLRHWRLQDLDSRRAEPWPSPARSSPVIHRQSNP